VGNGAGDGLSNNIGSWPLTSTMVAGLLILYVESWVATRICTVLSVQVWAYIFTKKCNVFFHQLAAHMLSSETCMLASQESLSNKRVCNEYDVEAISVNSHVGNLHMESVAKKSCLCNDNLASISNIEQSFASSLKLLLHTSIDNIQGNDKAFINYSSEDVSVISVLHRESDCIDNDTKPSSIKNIYDRVLNH